MPVAVQTDPPGRGKWAQAYTTSAGNPFNAFVVWVFENILAKDLSSAAVWKV